METAWPHLDSPDRFIRYAARIAVESQPVDQWRQRALEDTRLEGGLTALLALARMGAPEDRDRLLESLGRHWPDGMTEDQKIEALRICEVSFSRLGTPAPERPEQRQRQRLLSAVPQFPLSFRGADGMP